MMKFWGQEKTVFQERRNDPLSPMLLRGQDAEDRELAVGFTGMNVIGDMDKSSLVVWLWRQTD